ncbi:MAG TPA: asparagine synthase (glutamine-hydrolyzing), partial [Thermoanaerobaculia bacterium]|nr:asparagine synthase (glutamine-hydrolyzing) [Thermoanaerobaculia bacterium]
MCGIAGMLRLAADGPALDRAELARISAALARRGPDGEKAWASAHGRALLAHRRLAILDPTPRADQPMLSADGRHALILNGEIYDFREHRQRLVADGVPLRTTGDAEVLLELLAREGPAVLSSLRGMYAFALWDESRGELLLGRDPYGIKPLYYATTGGVLRFASQVRALEAGGGVPLEVDREAVAGFLAWGAIPEPRTLRAAIRALPAGHLLRATADGPVRVEPLPFRPPEREPRPVEAGLEECVRDHLVSDVPVALFLSAGLDSALVAALARRHLPEPPTALTLTFAEARGTARDEEAGARAIAAALGLPHGVREVAGGEVRELLPEIVGAMDQPSIDGVNTWFVSKAAAEAGLKVALSGLGGDELLGGYPSFRDVP